MNLSQLEGDKEGELTLGEGAVGRIYVSFAVRGRSRKLSLKGYFFSLHFWKNKPLNILFSNPNSCDIFFWKWIKLTSKELCLPRGDTPCCSTLPYLKKESRKPHSKCLTVHLILLTKACWSSNGERAVRVTVVLTPLRWKLMLSCQVIALAQACGLWVSCVKSVLSKACSLHSWLQARSSLLELSDDFLRHHKLWVSALLWTMKNV